MLINGLRFMTDDLIAIKRMSFAEYNLRMDAAKLKFADQLFLAAQTAFINRNAEATDKNSKYLAKEVKDLYDLEKIEGEILRMPKFDDDTFQRLARIQANMESYYKERGEM